MNTTTPKISKFHNCAPNTEKINYATISINGELISIYVPIEVVKDGQFILECEPCEGMMFNNVKKHKSTGTTYRLYI